MDSLIKEINMLENEIIEKEKQLSTIKNEIARSLKTYEIDLMKQHLLGLKSALEFINSEQ